MCVPEHISEIFKCQQNNGSTMQHCNIDIEFSGVPLLKTGLHVRVKGKNNAKKYIIKKQVEKCKI